MSNLSISFDCKPQRFTDDGDKFIDVSSGDTITNISNFYAYPILEIKGDGTVTIENNSNTYKVVVLSSCPTGTVIVDCETMDAYGEDGQNLNNYVTLPVKTIKLTKNTTFTCDGVTLRVKTRTYFI